MKAMSVTRDINLGTVVPILLWATGASIGGIWWASTITSTVDDVRAWQIRQDSRLEVLEEQQAVDNSHNARVTALLEVIQREVSRNNALLIEELRRQRQEQDDVR